MKILYEIKELEDTSVSLKINVELEEETLESLSKPFAIEILPSSAEQPYTDVENRQRFSHVCTLSEIFSFPDSIDPEYCYYRVGDIELILTSIDLAYSVLSHIETDIKKLIKSYRSLTNNSITDSGSITV